jgi:ribosomal protein S18 acetylase RimI-like enzyme
MAAAGAGGDLDRRGRWHPQRHLPAQANQGGNGAHVANAAFVVAATARGQGLGRTLAEHCLRRASEAGYRSMQFNAVVVTNTPAIALWRSLGFTVVGTVPGAFRPPDPRLRGLADHAPVPGPTAVIEPRTAERPRTPPG